VKKAIGYNGERGDQVEVISMPFYGSTVEEETKAMKVSPWQEYLKMGYKPVISLVLAFLFILFVIRPMLKKRAFSPVREMPLLQTTNATAPSTESVSEAMKPIPSLNLRDQAIQLIQGDPSKTVGIVKTWLHEKD
jgi:flagellar M-ring protein FliF